MTAPVAVALDTADPQVAEEWIDGLAPHARAFKAGPVLFHAWPAVGESVAAVGRLLFLDLKLHDIPSVVGLAMEGLARRGADRVTIHLSGGAEMAQAAVEAGGEAARPIGVTVLTSIDEPSWKGFAGRTVPDSVERMVETGWGAGVREFVCSGAEVSRLRKAFPEAVLWVPGIRFPGEDGADQRRVSTPQEVLAAGADWLVMGRSLTSVPTDQAVARLGALA